jgi:hypothetical protein
MLSVLIITEVVSLIPTNGEMYLIQHYVMNIVTNSCGSTNKTDHDSITEMFQ